MATIAEEPYVRLTTFTRDGRRKESPVWIAAVPGGRVGFTTAPDSWKAKRVRNTPRVELTPCDRAGGVTPGAPTVLGTATIGDQSEFEMVKSAIGAKYGWQFRLIELIAAVSTFFRGGMPAASGAILITLEEGPGPKKAGHGE